MRYILLSAFGLGCGSEKAITTYNNPPTASITSHSDGAEIYEGVTVNLIGQVADTNHSESELLVRWSSDVRELCPETNASADGAVSCQTSFEEGEQEIRLQVIDPEGEAVIATHSITVIPTQAPSVEILSPTIDDAYYSDQLILFSALITDEEDGSNDLTYAWSSNLDGDLPITAPLDADGMVNQYLNLTTGQHAISLVAEDTSGKRTTQTVAITVGGINQEPTCEILSPDSGTAFVEGESIDFSGFASDEDISNTQLTIKWTSSIDGEFNTQNADTDGGLAFSYNGLSKGSHTISLQVYDDVDSLCQQSVQLEIGSPPTIAITSPSNGSVHTVGDNIMFEGTVSDAEDVPSNLVIEWVSSLDGVFSNQSADSSGAITLPYSFLSAGTHSIVVTAQDSSGLSATTSLSLVVNTPPNAPSVSISPTMPYTNNDLEAIVVSGGDLDGDTVSHQYAWYNNGAPTSYTASILPASATSYGEQWTVRVTPNDGNTDGNYTETSVSIENTTPTIDSISITPDPAYNNSMLTCSASASDADQTVTPTYVWTVGTNTHSGDTLDISTLGVLPTQNISCTATTTDDAGAQGSDSVSITLSNRDPIITNEALSPTSIGNSSVVTCSADVSDPDGEIPTTTYEWTQNGSIMANGISIDLATYSVQVGDLIVCTITAEDGYGGTTTSSVSNTVTNAAPEVTSLELTPNPMYTESTLTAIASATDAEGDPISYLYEWFVNGSLVQSGSSPELDSSYFEKGEVVQVTLTVSDSFGTGIPESSSLTCQNTAPEPPTLLLTPTSPVEQADDLLCEIGTAATDVDGDTLSYTFSWTQNGSPFTGASSTSTISSVPATATTSGDVFVCSVDTYDGTDYSTTASTSVTIESEWDGAITFTPCGQSGRTGPTQSMCDTEYTSTSLDGEVTVIDGYQYWTVPSDGDYTIETQGAGGGDGTDSPDTIAGKGATMIGTFSFSEGTILKILVGQKGGDAFLDSCSHQNRAGGGGGGTFVANDSNIPFIVAGGGNGDSWGSWNTNGVDALTTNNGTGGGTQDGRAGGGGGFIDDGENYGSNASTFGQSFVNGGLGGDRHECNKGIGGFGGGGGTQYEGGGGGGYHGGSVVPTNQYSNSYPSYGAGSYNAGTNQSNTAGTTSGDGVVIIDKL